jgi:hypothetical protein
MRKEEKLLKHILELNRQERLGLLKTIIEYEISELSREKVNMQDTLGEVLNTRTARDQQALGCALMLLNSITDFQKGERNHGKNQREWYRNQALKKIASHPKKPSKHKELVEGTLKFITSNNTTHCGDAVINGRTQEQLDTYLTMIPSAPVLVRK